MNQSRAKTQKRLRRHKRIRARIKGTAQRPRLAVYRSNRFIYGQLIDDVRQATIASVKTPGKKTLKEEALEAGKLLAKQAVALGLGKAVFDRGGFSYAGSIKAFADGAREAGLEF